jgi:hypothetical protein
MAVEQVFLAQPVPSAGGRVIVSPFQFAVDGGDHLRIEGWNTLTGVSLQVSYRFARLAGTITAHRRDLALTADRLSTALVVALEPGYLVNLVVLVTGAAPSIGQTFVSIKLQRGLGAAAITLGLLVQGYVTAAQGLGWPGSPISDSVSGGGYLRNITGTDPAVGSEVAETVPVGARWELIGFRIVLVTSPTVIARRPILIFMTAALVTYMSSSSPSVSAASLTKEYVWNQDLAIAVEIASDRGQAGVPGAQLLAGNAIRVACINFQADDNWDAPTFTVKEYLEVD